jgi:FAD/FMN-containing dehydrogenase
MPHVTGIASRLAAVVGGEHVLTDDDVRAPYETDWTRRFGGPAAAVVRPADTEQVAGVLRACGEAGIAVVPQGGNTGLVGGGVPRLAGGTREQVVLSLSRLTALGEIDRAAAQVSAGAGVRLAALQHVARGAGLDAGVDFGARDTATVGGLVATDAGGIRAVRHGTVRARVAGVEAVLADGTVVSRMSGLLKDNAGYDLPALLVGSEGTLGVITAVRWRLVPRSEGLVAALVGLGSIEEAAAMMASVRALPSLEACELMMRAGIELTAEHLKITPPLDAPVCVLVETGSLDELASLDIEDAIVADDTASRERLWRLRESHTEAISAAGIPHKLDVGIPIHALAPFVEALPDMGRTIVFGHLGDGNLHVNVLGPEPDDERVDEAILRVVAEHGGTISAEHGVGVAKARFLELTRSAAEIEAMRSIKTALDPRNTLNPGVILLSPPFGDVTTCAAAGACGR